MTVIWTSAGSKSTLGVMAVTLSITVFRPLRTAPSTPKDTRALPEASESHTPEKDLVVSVSTKSVEPLPSACS